MCAPSDPLDAFKNYLISSLNPKVTPLDLFPYFHKVSEQLEMVLEGKLPMPYWDREKIIPYVIDQWKEAQTNTFDEEIDE